MARWQPLPRDLDPVVVQFIALLRHLKDRSGHTMRRLAAETGYSVSSWERYLAGRALPPAEAVEALAAAVGGDTARLLVMREAAEAAWQRPEVASAESGPGESVPGESMPVESVPTELSRRKRLPSLRTLATAAVAAIAGALAAVLLVPAAGAASPCSQAKPAIVVPSKPNYTCVYSRSGGLWYAGNSTTVNRRLVVDTWGPDVAELQCLLQHAGITPGGIDGSFGPLTEYAVIQAQKRFGLDVDGQVGPATWGALRK